MAEPPLYVRGMNDGSLPTLMTRGEAARRMTVSVETVDRLAAAGLLEKVRVSPGRVAIAAGSIDRHLDRLNSPPTDEPNQSGRRVPRRLELLRAQKAARPASARRRRAAA
jgi:hypothetical protein